MLARNVTGYVTGHVKSQVMSVVDHFYNICPYVVSKFAQNDYTHAHTTAVATETFGLYT